MQNNSRRARIAYSKLFSMLRKLYLATAVQGFSEIQFTREEAINAVGIQVSDHLFHFWIFQTQIDRSFISSVTLISLEPLMVSTAQELKVHPH